MPTVNTAPGTEETEQSETASLLERVKELEGRLGGTSQPLPPNAGRTPDGRYYHDIEIMTEGGTLTKQRRPLALSLEEAIATRADYYHPTLGLIYEGYKLARDRAPADIMADTSESMMKPEAASSFAALAGGN